MLYVFNVDTGTMVTFEMSLAVESVNHLKEQIERICKITSDKQVLLVSGGECLDPNARVCSYSAGTDTNPIYLFSKTDIEAVDPPVPTVESGSEIDFTAKVRECHDLLPSYNTVCHRAQLAQEFYESAREEIKICQNLVHEQHLQQQGWAAVIANLEDSIAEFTRRTEVFQKIFDDYQNERDSYVNFLQHFDEDLKTLGKIPMLPSLLEAEKKFFKSEKSIDQSTSKSVEPIEPTSDEPSPKYATLFDWISATDSKTAMEQLFEHCSRGLEQFDAKAFSTLRNVVQHVFFEAGKDDMKDIKGLSDRLCGLEQLMFEAKRYVQEQGDLAQSFLQNQNRASNIGDASILPDLCASHRKQLVVMLNNHQQLTDIRRRCVRAKSELGTNLHVRLKWVMYMENMMLELDHKMIVYSESLRRLRRHLEILQQIHLAPVIYLSAVSEVVRRRAFSQAFLSWASELACYLLTIHNDELTRRKDFQVQFEGHFLNSLFPGMEDMPPSFATEAPTIFDNCLPKLTVEDIEQLKQEFPVLAKNVSVPDIAAINGLFLVKSFVKTDLGKTDDRGVEEKIVQVVNEVGLASNLDHNLLKPAESETCLIAHGIPLLKDLDRGCESETDTEEFEKDNLQTSQTERDRLKALISKMAVLVQQAIGQNRVEIANLKSFVLTERSNMELQYEGLSSSWENLALEIDNKEKDIVQRITIDHELEINDYKKLTEAKDRDIKLLQNEVIYLQSSLQNSLDEISNLKCALDKLREEHEQAKREFEKGLNELKLQKDQSVKEVSEKLIREHKAEIESIRARFRLMSVAKMERSPSDPNLDGIERTEPKELINHEAIILQIKENCEIEKEKAISAAIIQESRKWENILNEKLTEMKFDRELMVNDITKKIADEKDKQIDVLREREVNLSRECDKYKNTIQQLAESETESQNVELLEKVEALEKEKYDLQTQLGLEKSKRIDESVQDMAASVAVCEGKVNVATSPIKHMEKLTKSQTSLVKSAKLTIDSCHCGDAVFILWDSTYKNYRIVQEGTHLYFLHSDCLETLGLNAKSEERKPYLTGEVIEKDYCHAKKEGNRYNVPRGTKFFRVKVKPLSNSKEIKEEPKEPRDKPNMSQSETAGPAVSECTSSDAASFSLPVTPLKQSPVEGEKIQKSEMEASTESSR